jgi:glycosyltransferase involved in cell wall biosynthesis
MEQIKILHIITTFDFGGAETLLKLIANHQSDNHDVTIGYLKGDGSLRSQLKTNISVIKFGLGISTVVTVRKYIRKKKPDIIHTHLGHADLLTMVSAVGLKGRYFSTMHNIWFKKEIKDYFFFGLYILFSHSLARRFKYIAISKTVYRHVNRNFRIPENRVRLIYNAIDISNLNRPAKKIEKNADKHFNVLFVGRLTLQKNLFFLLENFAELTKEILNLKLILVGDGELKNQLVHYAQKIGIEKHVSFEGYQANPDSFFSIADCFVLTSLFEGFGLVILEAFRAGVPVLAPDIEGPKELIVSGENGLLFESNNSEDFKLKFKKMHSSYDLRKNFADKAMQTLTQEFSISNYIDRLYSYYLN